MTVTTHWVPEHVGCQWLMGHGIVAAVLLLHHMTHVMLRNRSAACTRAITPMRLLLMAHTCLPYQFAMRLIMIGIVMTHMANYIAMAMWALRASAMSNAATLLAPVFFLLSMKTVMAAVMAGFSKANHLLTFAPVRLLLMMRQIMFMALAGEMRFKLTGKAIVVTYMN